MIARRLIVAVGVCLCVAGASRAFAQEPPGFRPGRLMVAGGGAMASGYPIGDVTATLRRNALGVPPPFTLVRAESELDRAVGVDARAAYALTRAFAVEVAGTYSKPRLAVTISQDGEAGDAPSLSEGISQYVIDVSGIYLLPINVGRRARTYAIGGAGYLRQLHEGRLLVETGATIQFGAGASYWLGGGDRKRRGWGLRGEARFVRRVGGVDFEDQARSFPSFSFLVFAGL